MNPLRQTGAIADTSLVLATVSGVLLLFFYVPSVTGAHASVVAMHDSFFVGLLRSVHRYSSDAAMFFVLVHAVRMVLEGRYGGPRWLAWVTGWGAVVSLWTVGWVGYWLVWDQRGLAVARSTSRLTDVLPVFTEPLQRAFLTQDAANSLLFFVVFFVHMLLPIGIVVLLWLHLARVQRPVWITSRPMTAWVVALTVGLSAVYPADVGAPAEMLEMAPRYLMDGWYLAPLVVFERIGPIVVWVGSLFAGAALLSVPWVFGRKVVPAEVDVGRCNACQKCFVDCPYDAIRMVPRTDGSTSFALQASVLTDKCMGCTICAGSCDSAGIGIPDLAALAVRKRVDGMLEEARTGVVFACSSASEVVVPRGWHRVVLPCTGWLHPLTVERALRRGAVGVKVVHCPPDMCTWREGARWTVERFTGKREPALRQDKVEPGSVTLEGPDRTLPSWVLAVLITGVIAVGSAVGYATPSASGASELVVTFRHAGERVDECRTLTQEELLAKPPHMRQPEECSRRRLPVTLTVSVDGDEVLAKVLPPSGLWGDGTSIALETIPVDVGEREVTVRIDDGGGEDVATEVLDFEHGYRHVVTFHPNEGFRWH